MTQNEKILVTGASGNLGQLVLEALLKEGRKNLIGTTRSPEKLERFVGQGVEIRKADFSDPSSLESAFEGATKLVLISATDVGARVGQHKNAIEAAKRAGVKHILYTSCLNPENSVTAVAHDHEATEKLIEASGLKYIFFRHSTYSEILQMIYLPNALKTGVLYGSAGPGKVSFILREDIACAAANAILKAEKYENKVFDITGSQAFSFSDIAEMVNMISSKKIKYVDVSPEEYKIKLLESGLPEFLAQLFVEFGLAIKKGEAATVSDAAQKLTGKAPRDLRGYLVETLK